MDMLLTAVTANLGCASPSHVLEQRKAAAARWGEHERELGTDLVFVQEIPGESWLSDWCEAGYQVTRVDGPTYRTRSAVIWRPPIRRREFMPVAEDYHGSYVASAGLELPGLGTPFAALSVHASPRVVRPSELDTYTGLDIGVPTPRDGGGRDSGRLFDADMLLHTLKISRLVHPTAGFLVAGDLNECVGWDADHGERWGDLYFTQVGELGLSAVLADLWKEERRTQWAAGKPPYQLDHVLATPEIAALICDAYVEPWDLEEAEAGQRSDHAPIRFSLRYQPDEALRA